jgi:hypothetical protein
VNAPLPRAAVDEWVHKSRLKEFTGLLMQIISGREQ